MTELENVVEGVPPGVGVVAVSDDKKKPANLLQHIGTGCGSRWNNPNTAFDKGRKNSNYESLVLKVYIQTSLEDRKVATATMHFSFFFFSFSSGF